MRLNVGNTDTDHHSLFLLEAPGDPSFNHAAFEVSDVDDLMTGQITCVGTVVSTLGELGDIF